jgi:hypothetical protein
MLAAPATKYRRPLRTKSGVELPRLGDARTVSARRFKGLVETFTAELGGSDTLSEADKSLICQAATLLLAAERLQVEVVSGAEVDADALVRLNSEARRALGMLRAKAKAKPAGHQDPLAAHLQAKYGTAIAEDDGGDAEDVAAVE